LDFDSLINPDESEASVMLSARSVVAIYRVSDTIAIVGGAACFSTTGSNPRSSVPVSAAVEWEVPTYVCRLITCRLSF
jgi:hypothetical protein